MVHGRVAQKGKGDAKEIHPLTEERERDTQSTGERPRTDGEGA